MTRHKRHKIKLRSMYQWHRYLGVSVALFVLILSVSGIMLNHTGALALDKHFVKSNILLDWYGVYAPEKIYSYKTSQGWISQWDSHLYMDNKTLGEYSDKLLGATVYQGMLIVALERTILLFTPQGELIEILRGTQGVPAGMWAIGLGSQQQLVVNSAHGTYVADQDIVQWQHSKADSVKWSAPSQLPDSIYQIMLENYRGQGLSMERLFLDLHSGRLFGQFGVYLVDLAGLLMMFLACSGLWLWSMRLLRERQRQH